MQFGAIVMGCRKCLAAPGAACEWASGPRDAAIHFHAIRERDAATASELWDPTTVEESPRCDACGYKGPPARDGEPRTRPSVVAPAPIDPSAGVSRRRKARVH